MKFSIKISLFVGIRLMEWPSIVCFAHHMPTADVIEDLDPKIRELCIGGGKCNGLSHF